MKHFLLLVVIVTALFSCQDNQENRFLRETIETQKLELEELDKLRAENVELKEKLNNCMFGNPNKDMQKIGKWLDNRPAANIQLILNKNTKTGKYYLTSKFADSSTMTEEVRVTTTNGLMKFESIENDHNEWFIREKNGDLSMWSQNGKFGTALCF